MDFKDILKQLCSASGIFGYEQEVTKLIAGWVSEYADDIFTDSLGSLYVFKKGQRRRKSPVVLCAHMDEVGYYISQICDDGKIKIVPCGYIEPTVAVGMRVEVGMGKYPGVICGSATSTESLFVDFGAKSYESAAESVKVGEPVTLHSEATEYFDDRLILKAVDDRAGCAILVKLIEEDIPFDTWFVFSVGEEPGLRGSSPVFSRIKPTKSMILEGSVTLDALSLPESLGNLKIGCGPTVYTMDMGITYSNGIINELTKQANNHKVPFQLRGLKYGMTDGYFAQGAAGGQVVCIGVPARNLHTSYSMICYKDACSALELARLFVDFSEAVEE